MLSSTAETVVLKFEKRIIAGKLPSVPAFAFGLINSTCLSSLAYATVSVHYRVTYITNEALASKHDCVLSERASYLNMSRREHNECV
jgi:hypothetical protein